MASISVIAPGRDLCLCSLRAGEFVFTVNSALFSVRNLSARCSSFLVLTDAFLRRVLQSESADSGLSPLLTKESNPPYEWAEILASTDMPEHFVMEALDRVGVSYERLSWLNWDHLSQEIFELFGRQWLFNNMVRARGVEQLAAALKEVPGQVLNGVKQAKPQRFFRPSGGIQALILALNRVPAPKSILLSGISLDGSAYSPIAGQPIDHRRLHMPADAVMLKALLAKYSKTSWSSSNSSLARNYGLSVFPAGRHHSDCPSVADGP